MLNKVINKLCANFYNFIKVRANIYQKELKLIEYKDLAIFDDSVSVTEAIIQNYRENRRFINIGAKSVILGELMLFKHGGNIKIGKDCFIGPQTKIWSAKNIVIGNRVLISHNVNIHDNISHPVDSKLRHDDFVYIFSKGGFQENIDLNEKEIIIGDDVWIGFNVIILKGVKIGKGAIIGAGTIVTKDIPDFAIVVGNHESRIVRYTT